MAIEVIRVTDEDIAVTLTDVGIRGRAGLVFRGDYDNSVQYYQGDSVRFSNNLYIASGSPAVGTDPTDSLGNENEGWELLVFGSPDQTAIVDFHIQTSLGSIIFAEGDLIKGINGNYYWTLGSGTLENSTNLDNESEFELRGNPINIVGNGDISSRPTSGDEIGDFWVTTDGESSIWDGTQWLAVNNRLSTPTDDGLMSSSDKSKLDNIENNAELNDQVEVDYDDATRELKVTSKAAGVSGLESSDILPKATDLIEGLVKIDTNTLSITDGTLSADETLELGKLSDITAPTLDEDNFVLRAGNTGSDNYSWVPESIRLWDTTGNTDYIESDGSEVGSIVEHTERLYIATSDVVYETNGSCEVSGTLVPAITDRTNCLGTTGGAWIIPTPSEDSNWNEIGPGSISNIDDVDLSVAEAIWEGNDQPILARVKTSVDPAPEVFEWRLFPGLDTLTNVGDIPVPTDGTSGTEDQTDFVLTTGADGTFFWSNRVARIQDFDTAATYATGDLVRSNNQIWLSVSTNDITPSNTLPSDGSEWQLVGPESLAELQDTSFTTPQQGNVLTFDSGAWRNLTANASIAAALTFQEIGDIPANSLPEKVLVSTDAVNTEAFDVTDTYNQEDVVFFSGNYYRYIGTNGATLTQTPDLDTSNWDLTNGEKYEWKDYGRDIKNIQIFDSTRDYLAGDLVEHLNKVYIAIAGVNSPVSAPLGNDSDTVWKQLGASSLVNIEGIDDPSTVGQVLSYTGDVGSVPQFGWTSSIETAARIPAFANNEAYAEGALVTTGTGASLAVFIALKAVAASSTVPTDDGVNWEIIGPERMQNLEDVVLTSLAGKDILQYDGVADWKNVSPATLGGDMILANIGDVTTPVSADDANKVLQVTFSGDVPTYAWIDRTTNTTTIQAHSITKNYTAGEIVYHANAVYLAIGSATNLNKVPGAVGSESFWQIIGPETFEELEDWDSSASDPQNAQFIVYDATATANDGSTGAWKPYTFFNASTNGDTLGGVITRDSNGFSVSIDASAYPTLSDFQDKASVGDTLGVNFTDTSGVITADVDASGYIKPADFKDTANDSSDTLGVNFTAVDDSVTATVDASEFIKVDDFNDTTNSGDTLGVDFTKAVDGDITATVDASAYAQHGDFKDTANSGDTLGVDFTGADDNITATIDASDYAQHGDFKDTANSGDTLGVNFTGADDNITATVDASAYPTLTDFHDKSNSGDTLGVNFTDTAGVITADIDASDYPKAVDFKDTTNSGDTLGVDFTLDSGTGEITAIVDASEYPKVADFNDTSNSGDTLGVNFEADAGGDISATIDASSYAQHGDFKDTTNSGDTLGVNFTGADDNITATVDASAYPTLSDFQDTSNTGDTLGVNFTETGGIITATINVAGVSDLTEYTTGRNYSSGDTVWLSTDNKIYRNTNDITSAPSTFDSDDWQVLSGDSVWDGLESSLLSTAFLDGRFTQPSDFTDTANSGDTLGIDFTASASGVTGTVDASSYTQPGDFKDTANSGKTLGINFTGADDNVTGTVDVDGFYDKTESDARFEPLDSSYEKAEADARFEPIDSAYEKAEADARFEPIDSAYTKSETYNKTESDARFEPIDSAYTKSEADALFLSTGEESIIPFDSSIGYSENELVDFSGAIYRAIQDITAPVSPATLSNPDSDTTNWIVMAHDTRLEQLTGVDTPVEDGHVLRANVPTSGAITYSWTSRNTNTASIQGYDSDTTYSIGDLVLHLGVIYLALKPNDNDSGTTEGQVTPGTDETTWETVGPESIEKLSGVTVNSGVASGDLLRRTGADTWETISPEDVAKGGIDLVDLQDIKDLTQGANLIIQRNSGNDGWIVQTPAQIATSGIDFSDLKDVSGTATSGHVQLGDGSAWASTAIATATNSNVDLHNLKNVNETADDATIGQILHKNNGGWEYTSLSTAADDTTSGIALENLHNVADTVEDKFLLQKDGANYIAQSTDQILGQSELNNIKDVDTVIPGDNSVLQYDGTAGVKKYKPVDTDEILNTGKLGSLKDVPTPDISATGSSEIGKVLTVRETSGAADYKWESPTTASIQSFDSGSATVVSSYGAGDIVEHDTKIWIATKPIANVLPATNPAPGSTSAGNDWDLVGPESIDQLNDVNIGTIANDDFLQRKSGEWVNRTVSEVSAEIDLTSLKDVDQDDTVANGDLLKRTNDEWQFTATAGSLNIVIDDVDTSSNLSNSDVLTYRASDSTWINSKLGTLDSLSDTNVTNEIAGQTLEFDLLDTQPTTETACTVSGGTWSNPGGAGTCSGAGEWVNKFRGLGDSTPRYDSPTAVADTGVALTLFDGLAGILSFGSVADAKAFIKVIGGEGEVASVSSSFELRSGANGAPQLFGGATFIRNDGVNVQIVGLDVQSLALTAGLNLFFQEGNVIVLDKFNGHTIRNYTGNIVGHPVLSLVTDAETQTVSVTDPETVFINWDASGTGLDVDFRVTGINDALFQDRFLNSIDKVELVNDDESSKTVITSTQFPATPSEDFITSFTNDDATNNIYRVADPRIGQGYSATAVRYIKATLSDNDGNNFATDNADTTRKVITFAEANYELSVNPTQITKPFFSVGTNTFVIDANLLNTSSGSNTSVVAAGTTYEGSALSLSNSADEFVYTGTVTGSLNLSNTSDIVSTELRFSKGAENVDITKTFTINLTSTYPVLHGFTNQGLVPTQANLISYTPISVANDGSEFEREYESITNSSGNDQTLWFGIKTSAVTGTPTFSSKKVGGTDHVLTNIISNSITLTVSSVDTSYNLYGIPLVSSGESVIITIS